MSTSNSEKIGTIAKVLGILAGVIGGVALLLNVFEKDEERT